MARPARILSVGWFGEGNLGDEAMLQGLVTVLRRTLGDPGITVVTADPADTGTRFGVETLRRATPEGSGFRNVALVRASQRSDLVTLGGGDLIREQADGTVPAHNWLARVRVALALHRPVALVGVSVGELRTPAVIEAVRRDLARCAILSVRDEESAQRLREITGREVVVTGDLALEALDVPAREPAPTGGPPRIGVAIRNIHGRGPSVAADAGERLTASLAAALDRVTRESGARIELVPFRAGRARRDDDALAGEALAARADGGAAWRRHEAPASVDDFTAIARDLDLIVGVRLHATVLGAAAGLPVVGVAYDPKVSGFLGDLGLPGQCLPLDADADSLATVILRSLEDPSLADAVAQGVARMRARTAAFEPVLRAAANR